nr:GNAT family N-acetyltransferase [uncultured Niameybacter sp.]
MQLTIRPYEVKDAVFLTPLIVDELGHKGSTQEQIVMRLRRFHVHPDYHTLVATNGREVVGFIGLHKGMAYEFDEDYVNVIALVVKKPYQIQEVGSQLLDSVELYAKKRGIKKIIMNSDLPKEDTYCFYEEKGYLKKGYLLEKNL